ncbi:hypothetical protein MPLDJ20_330019 [Mesorhizobium plurifarium]|uniref:Uncharacterized protein n=1 Tax=Mesorhizobium plurifarium TaxID=69974 RepID=A0A090FC54_MESPL|nr:hypothetical protein MPLDJ20_330019 [Mesorhizobium plurifarium]
MWKVRIKSEALTCRMDRLLILLPRGGYYLATLATPKYRKYFQTALRKDLTHNHGHVTDFVAGNAASIAHFQKAAESFMVSGIALGVVGFWCTDRSGRCLRSEDECATSSGFVDGAAPGLSLL